MPKRTKKTQASAAATRKGRRAARGSEASRDFYEAIERILTLGGVACQPGWFITDVSMRWKLDTARENLERMVNEKPQNDLLAALREYEEKHRAFMSIPRLLLYGDGSGRLENMHGELFSFHNTSQALELFKAANADLSGSARDKSKP